MIFANGDYVWMNLWIYTISNFINGEYPTMIVLSLNESTETCIIIQMKSLTDAKIHLHIWTCILSKCQLLSQCVGNYMIFSRIPILSQNSNHSIQYTMLQLPSLISLCWYLCWHWLHMKAYVLSSSCLECKHFRPF